MRKVEGFLLFIFMCAFAWLYFNVLLLKCPEIAPALMGTFMVFEAYLAYHFYGFPRFETTPIQVTLIRGMVGIMIMYFIILYVLGAFSGFNKVCVSLSIIAPIITIIATEILRYIMINANRDTGIFPFLTTAGIILLQTVQVLDLDILINSTSIALYLVTVFTPLFLRNLLLTVYAHHVDYKLEMFYALFITQYKSIFPYIPDLNAFSYSYADIILSFLVLITTYRLIAKNYDGYTMITLKDGFSFLDLIIFFVFISFGILISGVTPLQIYAVNGHEDINGKIVKPVSTDIDIGDGPVVYKGITPDKLVKGDVILRKENYDGVEVVKLYAINRVETIEPESKNDDPIYKIYIVNDLKEEEEVNNDDIYGKVLVNFKYVFVPALYIQDYLSNGGSKA